MSNKFKNIILVTVTLLLFNMQTISAQSCHGAGSSNSGNSTYSTPNKYTFPSKSFYYQCPMHSDVQASTPGKCLKCGMDLVKHKNTVKVNKKVYYVCPNHSETHQDKKGYCPICKHKLKKMKLFIY